MRILGSCPPQGGESAHIRSELSLRIDKSVFDAKMLRRGEQKLMKLLPGFSFPLRVSATFTQLLGAAAPRTLDVGMAKGYVNACGVIKCLRKYFEMSDPVGDEYISDVYM